MRRLPFLFAHIKVFVTGGAAPIDPARGLARQEAAVLPEVFPRSGPSSAVQPVNDGGGDTPGLENEARPGLGKRARLAARALRGPDLVLVRAHRHPISRCAP